MYPYNLLSDILNIQPNNEFINYIVKRLQREYYRGVHISQHNRYDYNYIITLIEIIYKIAKDNFFEIPAGDYSERTGKKDYNIIFYPEYKQIVDSINSLTGKGTYNSIKKNFFVDLERMGLLERTRDVKYARLTKDAIHLILLNKSNKRKAIKEFTDLIDENLFGNFLSELVEFMWLYGYEKIDIYEYTFILNDFYITNTYKDILLRSYRNLTNIQKNKLIDLIKEFAKPENFIGDKTQKRDFHNWINESQQIFSLLKFTTYFQVIEENGVLQLILNTSNETGIFSINEMKRNQAIKQEYFELHNVPKLPDFELHHIIPIKVAINKKDMEKIDNVLNLIYIHKNGHKLIHKNNTYQIKEINLEKFELNNIKTLQVNIFYNQKDVYFSTENNIINKLKKYNEKLINEYYDNIYQIS
jgi:hypothetical protein